MAAARGARLHYFWYRDKIWSADQYSEAVGKAMYVLSGNADFGHRKTRALQSFLCETFVRFDLFAADGLKPG